MDRLSDGYLVRTNESLYSVQSMANIRIRLIFDSSNTLVNHLGPSVRTRQVAVHVRGRPRQVPLYYRFNEFLKLKVIQLPVFVLVPGMSVMKEHRLGSSQLENCCWTLS